MKIIKKKYFFLLVVTFGLLGAYFLLNNHFNQLKLEKVLKNKKNLQDLVLASQSLKKIWKEGRSNDLSYREFFKCEKSLKGLENLDLSYFRCNPNFIECLLNKTNGKINYKDKNGLSRSVFSKREEGRKKFGKVITRWSEKGEFVPNFSYSVNLSLDDTNLTLLLEDSCNDVFLPQRSYSYGRGQGKNDLIWDNFDQGIFIDKFQVTFRDILEWKKTLKQEYKSLKTLDLSESANGLTMEEMKDYCSYKGKKLLQAHVWDAATYIPQNYENVRPRNIVRNRYPWTRQLRKSFLWKSRNSSNFIFEKKFCKKAFTRDCLNLVPYKNHSIESSSWVGLYQVLGGLPEVVFNPIQNNKNLKLSSFYFPSNSPWHELGKRAYWDGTGFKRKNIFWKKEIDFDKGIKLENKKSSDIKIGFRCMRNLR
tara:strand:- start:1783 stop:3048 length:1266 start_codon:yes stop_codon:yes gene_type:complete